PFLIAHFQGDSIVVHHPAAATFLQADITVPDNITIVTFATKDILDVALLPRQLNAAGIAYRNPAGGFHSWRGTDKLMLLGLVLPKVTTEYALILDGFDVLLCGKLDPIFERFARYRCKVLFGASKNGEGDGNAALGEYRYLNSGTGFGRTEDLTWFYQRALKK